jgi:hypothetical protein
MTRLVPDELTLCENCEERPSISVTDDDVDLCAECELALMDEMAAHEDDCDCAGEPKELFDEHCIECHGCKCGLDARIERRKAWLREQIAKGQA